MRSCWRRVRRLVSVIGISFLALLPAHAASAPDFSLPTDNGELRLSTLRGKVVYLDYWASWCTPCRTSFPWMNEMQSRYADSGLVVIAVNLDKDESLVRRFLAKYPAHFIVAYDPGGVTAGVYEVQGMPSSYLIDRAGNITSRHVGFRENDKTALEARIRALTSR